VIVGQRPPPDEGYQVGRRAASAAGTSGSRGGAAAKGYGQPAGEEARVTPEIALTFLYVENV
jgi:hypothetical protein